MYLALVTHFLGSGLAGLVLGMLALGAVVPARLDAALRTCHPCPTIPPAPNWVEIDRIDSSRAQPGQDVFVRTDGYQCQDTIRRYWHVRGIRLNVRLQYTAGATNDAVSAYQLRGLIESWYLEDNAGFNYLGGSIDGRDLLDDSWIRHWGHQQTPYLQTGVQGYPRPSILVDEGIPANVGAGTHQVDISIDFPLVTRRKGASKYEGLIPLGMLQLQGYQSLRFRLRDDFLLQSDGDVQPPTKPAGLTIDSYINPVAGNTFGSSTVEGISVWFDLVALPALVRHKWQIQNERYSDQQGRLAHPERVTRYAVVRFKPEDDAAPAASGIAGQPLAGELSNIEADMAGTTFMKSLTAKQALYRFMQMYGAESDGALVRNNAAQDLPVIQNSGTNAENPNIVVLLPYRPSEACGAGGINYDFGVDPLSYVRFLHRTDVCLDQNDADVMEQVFSCSPCRSICSMDSRGMPMPGLVSNMPLVVVPGTNAKRLK